jgi:hypothetical protein
MGPDGHRNASELLELARDGHLDLFVERVADLVSAGRLASVGPALAAIEDPPLPVRVLVADLRARSKAIELYDLTELDRRIRAEHPGSVLSNWMGAILAEWGLWKGDMSTVGYSYGDPSGLVAESRLAQISEGRRLRIRGLATLATEPGTAAALSLAAEVRTIFDRIDCHEERALTDVVFAYGRLAITDDLSVEPMAVLRRGVKELDRIGADRLPFGLACLAWSAYMIGDFGSAADAIDRYDEVTDPTVEPGAESTSPPPPLPPLVSEGVEMLRGLAALAIEGPSTEVIDRIGTHFERLRRHTLPTWFVGPVANDLLDVGETELAAQVVATVGSTVTIVRPAHQAIREVELRLRLLQRSDRTAIDELWQLYDEWQADGRWRRAATSAARCSWTARRAGLDEEADRLIEWGRAQLPPPDEQTQWERMYIEGTRSPTDVHSRGRLRVLAPDLLIERDGATVRVGDVQAKLLALLAAVRRPVTTDWIVTALWSEADLDAGRNRLGAVLHRLRQKLNLLPDELIRRNRHGIELDGTGWEIDVWQFWDLSGGDEAERLAAYEIYGSDLAARQLAYDDLLDVERGRLRRRWRETAASLVDAGRLTADQVEARGHLLGLDHHDQA